MAKVALPWLASDRSRATFFGLDCGIAPGAGHRESAQLHCHQGARALQQVRRRIGARRPHRFPAGESCRAGNHLL